ncbi:PQQ-binding-like beta-propeller repeat protein [Streptomyces sp. NPDC091371]|uniref:outer membrane protein assembly factor BamB family protein n=1 Tax=Streptomyces sp. NPDC091371 TaxID=3155303 RepID=UPI0034327976
MIATMRWERELHQRGARSAYAVGEDCVVLHERLTRLVCVERADGAVRWDIPAGTWPRAIVLAGDRVLVLPQQPDRLSCLDLGTGAVLWSVPTPRFTGHLAVTGDSVVIGGWRGYTPMAGLDLADGRVRWTKEPAVHWVTPLVWGGGVLTGAGSDAVLFDARGGGESARWRLPEPLSGPDGDVFISLGGERVAARCGPSALAAFGCDSGVADWHRAYEPFAGFGYAAGSVWMHRPRSGHLAVDPADGTRRWPTDTGAGQGLVPGVVPSADGFLVGADNGLFFRLGPDGRAVSRCSSGRRLDRLVDAGNGEVFVVAKGTFGRWAVSAGCGGPAG